MTPEEFLACIIAVYRYLREFCEPTEIKQGPKIWKTAARMRE